MNHKTLIDILRHYGLSKAEAYHAWETVINTIQNELLAVRSSTLPGLGTLHVRTRAARPERPGRNPQTGAAMTIPAKPEKKAVVLVAAKALKDAINT